MFKYLKGLHNSAPGLRCHFNMNKPYLPNNCHIPRIQTHIKQDVCREI